VFVIIGVGLNIVILAQYFDAENGGVFYVRFTEPNEVAYIKNMDIFKYLWGDVWNKPNNLSYSGLSALKKIKFWLWRNDMGFSAFHHVMNIFLSFGLMIKLIKQEKEAAIYRQYTNKFLSKINQIIGKHYSLWALLLLVPVFLVITIILILFGQDKDSLIKVWTETTTWTFSQHEHPPFLDHEGHYLCTVAACGHQKVVKPLRLGKRHNRTIIVNRQLLIANAYEEIINRAFPKLHQIIRNIYDMYGYPVSRHIKNKYMSDIVYILMKPLEYFFLVNLYLFVKKPEALINQQYRHDVESNPSYENTYNVSI
jgi:hypothetical protein